MLADEGEVFKFSLKDIFRVHGKVPHFKEANPSRGMTYKLMLRKGAG